MGIKVDLERLDHVRLKPGTFDYITGTAVASYHLLVTVTSISKLARVRSKLVLWLQGDWTQCFCM